MIISFYRHGDRCDRQSRRMYHQHFVVVIQIGTFVLVAFSLLSVVARRNALGLVMPKVKRFFWGLTGSFSSSGSCSTLVRASC